MKNFVGPFVAIVAAGALGVYLLRNYVQDYQKQAADDARWAESVASRNNGDVAHTELWDPNTVGPWFSDTSFTSEGMTG
jgi:hypothetical protein